jgi:ATP-dependent protease ClpP protease subunit
VSVNVNVAVTTDEPPASAATAPVQPAGAAPTRRFARQAHDRIPVRAQTPATRSEDGIVTLRLYDVIDSWGGAYGVSAREFVEVLDGLPADTSEIRLHINSPGGEVWEGLAILNALRGHKARVVAVVEGMAASSASFIACGVDELEMAPNSELFIHNAWGLCVGNAGDMKKMAADLTHEDTNIASIYKAKAGGDVADWLTAMAAETYYSADEALAAGLADRVGPRPADAAAQNRWDRTIFATRATRPAPATQASAIPPSPRPASGQEGGSMSDLTKFREALGLPENVTVTDEAILAALETLPDPKEEEPPTSPAAALPDGVVAIDATALEQLKADAAAGREARNAQVAAHRAQLVEDAVRDGRIPPVRRDAWVAQLAADPGAEQVLAGLPKGTIPVEAAGHGADNDLDSDDAFFNRVFATQEGAH